MLEFNEHEAERQQQQQQRHIFESLIKIFLFHSC